ncbi:MAG: bifunctional phosphoribosylaminoimidazolecarboxamide formyltransferase/IMP cyclohydrolase, partial [Chloroflexota bacterium]|nr:bifunctional phosphoribosylaminoimidazolecarboxamide formyltransferase/IMP cyclohydrolase [Chloroflexota bacterium]
MRALLSVFDKTGVVEFAQSLADLGFEIISTGGTQQQLSAAGVKVTAVADVTGFPELLDGRVKTLHPRIHAGLLARRDNATHLEQLAAHGIPTIDLFVANLYPFGETIRDPRVGVDEAVEQIDIGGPAMIRAAAKNFAGVTVLTDPADYPMV